MIFRVLLLLSWAAHILEGSPTAGVDQQEIVSQEQLRSLQVTIFSLSWAASKLLTHQCSIFILIVANILSNMEVRTSCEEHDCNHFFCCHSHLAHLHSDQRSSWSHGRWTRRSSPSSGRAWKGAGRQSTRWRRGRSSSSLSPSLSTSTSSLSTSTRWRRGRPSSSLSPSAPSSPTSSWEQLNQCQFSSVWRRFQHSYTEILDRVGGQVDRVVVSDKTNS